ncbi:MAG: hypothetical protein FVQ81_13340, partial [Candidatus Glassbacteria bacterium]|nr:hypothetical protein [Candidatus Glassbacteria bacterium]
MSEAAADTVAKLPKIELHVHFEGCIGPEMLAAVSAGRKFAKGAVEDLYRFDDFPGFLKAYSRVMDVLDEPADFRLAARGIANALDRRNVVYVEFIFTPLPHIRRGLDHNRVIEAILRGLDDARGDGAALESAFIYDTVRQWGPQAAEDSAEIAVGDLNQGLPVVGFGVGGDELGCPAAELRPAFQLAAD